jgi:hypothetical protein
LKDNVKVIGTIIDKWCLINIKVIKYWM